MTDSSDTDLLNIFWVEVDEYLQSLNAALLQVETLTEEDDEALQDLLREMNRVAHSMKGAARAVGINLIETVAHYMEEVFAAALDRKLALTPDVADSVYDGLDLIQNVAQGEDNNAETVSAVLSNLEAIVAQVAGAPDEVTSVDSVEPAADHKDDSTEVPAVQIDETSEIPSADDTVPTVVMRSVEETIRVTVSKLDSLMAEASELLIARLHGEERQRTVAQLRHELGRWQREWRSIRASYIRLARRVQENEDEVTPELSRLIKFLEENQRHLYRMARSLAHLGQALVQDNMHLNMLADQLQNDISGMRMMPFETITGSFYRMMRDLARELNKQIQLDIQGASVEIDKAVLDALKDPLLHLLRNAIDHGIEPPAVREKAGKAPTGCVTLVVEQRGSEITISVSDDGQGIDIPALRRNIVRAGHVSEAEAEALSDDEIRPFIFQSGLTTSDRVTALSGRGIGMDVVRDRVENLRGRVSVRSEAGEGTTIILSVPVSLTRIRCILLALGDESYALPSALVTRMETLHRDDVFTAEGKEMMLVGGQPVPLVSLGAILGVPAITDEDRDRLQVLVLHTADRTVAFEVDELQSETELVLKPLGPELANAPFVAGAALLGTGNVIVVLDANDLVRKASGIAIPRRRAREIIAPVTERPLRVLVVDDSITTRTLEKNILETAGFEVGVAIDGVEAWSVLNEMDFDVAVCDVEMPNMDGLELTRRMKEATHTRHIPVILLTSLSKPEQREAGLRAGADAYLVKSRFDQGELLRTIQTVVV